MATYSQAREAPNASPLSAPPLPLVTIHDAIRTPATEARYAQNSVVLSACFVSVESRDGRETRMSAPCRVAPSVCTAMSPPQRNGAPLPAAPPTSDAHFSGVAKLPLDPRTKRGL